MIRKLTKNVALYSVGVAIGVVFVLLWDSLRSSSSLTDGLPTEWNNAAEQFGSRLRTRFPVGMPAEDFIRELNNEGFRPTWFVSGGYYGAVRKEGWIPCRVSARVYWRLGPGDTLAFVGGDYREEGCL